jgi:hypothetical protein
MTVRVPQELDLRRFPSIPRGTKQFERLYNGLTAVERVNARLKVFWGADDGNVVGSRRIHIDPLGHIDPGVRRALLDVGQSGIRGHGRGAKVRKSCEWDRRPLAIDRQGVPGIGYGQTRDWNRPSGQFAERFAALSTGAGHDRHLTAHPGSIADPRRFGFLIGLLDRPLGLLRCPVALGKHGG